MEKHEVHIELSQICNNKIWGLVIHANMLQIYNRASTWIKTHHRAQFIIIEHKHSWLKSVLNAHATFLNIKPFD